MKYLSVCSGIESATVAWHPMGWEPFAFAEIEPFPCAVLKYHYPRVPNLGDITKFKSWPDAVINVLVGGTPCQSFSVAGLRKGMADPRGNLALTYLAIAERYRPEWIIWENVPGVLSSNGGRDFGAILGGLGQLGYGFAYRVLDAQYVRVDGFGRAVPQRRRRVFVVGNLRDWRRAAAVFFERESLSWDHPPRRKTGEGIAPTISARPTGGGGLGTDFDLDGGQTAVSCAVADTLSVGANQTTGFIGDDIAYADDVARCVTAGFAQRLDWETENFVANPLRAQAQHSHRVDSDNDVIATAHSLRAEGFDASEDGTGRGTPLVPVSVGFQGDTLVTTDMAWPCLSSQGGNNGGGAGAVLVAPLCFAHQQGGSMDLQKAEGVSLSLQKSQGLAIAFTATDYGGDATVECSPTMRAGTHANSHSNGGVTPAIAFQERGRDAGRSLEVGGDIAFALTAPNGGSRSQEKNILQGWAVRRLTPRECERLQGFPDGYTDIPWRNKNWTPDGPRYKSLGNSKAVNVIRWIGRRIEMVQRLVDESA